LVLWISAATTEKLNDGFAKILDLIRHPARLYPVEQSSKLTEARRWLEGSTAISWLVLGNVDVSTFEFLRESLPRHNWRGNILFTTRTAGSGSALSHASGQQHPVLELELPDARGAVNLLLKESGIGTVSGSWLTMNEQGYRSDQMSWTSPSGHLAGGTLHETVSQGPELQASVVAK
jgi:hypothetical protein